MRHKRIRLIVPTISGRKRELARCLNSINDSIYACDAPSAFEIQISTSTEPIISKHNLLLTQALREVDYFTFIDDDDMVTIDYCQDIIDAMYCSPDLISIDMKRVEVQDRIPESICTHDIKHEGPAVFIDQGVVLARPGHHCVWNADLYLPEFPQMGFGWDGAWCDLVAEKFRGYAFQVIVPKPNYIYMMDAMRL